MNRRAFMKDVAAGGAVVYSGLNPRESQSASPATRAAGYKFLTFGQALTLGAICDQIVPADEFPGAKEAGVVGFIDSVLAGKMGGFYRKQYQNGLLMIERVSKARYGGPFVSLPWKTQTAVLHDIESGKAAGAAGKRFFSLVIAHTMEGYYGDPSHGGNRNGTSWKMIGFGG